MNGPTVAQVDAAVRDVLAGLGGPKRSEEERVYVGQLLGLSQAETLGREAGEVRVRAGTVITPLARDYLKKLGLVVRLVSDTAENASKFAEDWGFAIEVETGTTAAVRRGLMEGADAWKEVGRITLEAANWAASGPHRGAAVLTEEAAVSCWKAHAVEGVRAAVACEAEAVERAIRTLGVNLLFIEPGGKSIPWIRHLLTTFRRGGAPKWPDVLVRGPRERAGRDEDRRGDRADYPVSRPSGPAERALRDRLAHAARGPGRGLVGPR